MSKYDIVIKNGKVFDGTGNPWVKRDIAVSAGKIVNIGYINAPSKSTIYAEGKIVSPGFIDLHNHSDLSILPYPNADNFLMQGVTTAVVGNCGLSLAPANHNSLNMLRQYMTPFLSANYNYGWNWTSFKEYLDQVGQHGTSINLAPLVGQGTIRLACMGFVSRRASEKEIDDMKKIISQSCKDGAFGMSYGLIYPPGSFCSTEELISLACAVRDCGGILTIHLRDEADHLIESVEEAILISKSIGVPSKRR